MSVHSGFEARRVVIIGAGTLGRVVADILLTGGANARLTPVGFVDSDPARTGELILGLPVFGTPQQLAAIPHEAVIVAVSDDSVREQMTIELEAAGEHLTSARHPFSSIAHGVQMGAGAIISAGAVVGPSARIGRGIVVGTNACIEAEATIPDFTSVAAGAVVGTRSAR